MTGHLVVAALRWDPHVRGGLIVLVAIAILVGSVYLLLSTNTGARLGFVLAAAGLFGWMTVMGVIWTVFGIGIKGSEPSWKTLEVVTGDLSQSTVAPARTFPRGWRRIPQGDEALADAEAAADAVLSGSGGEEGGEGGEGGHGGEGGGAKTEVRIEPPFDKKEDYQPAGAYRKGGETWFFTLRHRPHYAAIQVKPSSSAPPDVQARPVTTVIMLRDLGNLRAPSFFFTVFSAIVFGVSCYALHVRDREALARQRSVT